MQNIIITNEKKLNETISKMKKDGSSKVHIVSDFDRTLTKAFVGNKKMPSVIAQIREGGYLGEDYIKKAFELRDIYHPIEINPSIPVKEKDKKMNEWWRKHFDLLISSGMNKQVITDIVNKRKIIYRKDLPEFLKILNKDNIPLIIISGAVGDIIKESLKSEKINFPNIHLIANMFIWNKNGIAIGVKEPIIHTLNKHETEIKNLPIYSELLNRKNIILLGDLIEDLDMIKGFPYKNLIKIGFLNESIKENIELYKKNFDIIITDDSGMDYVNELLKKIIS
jgi:cytosolic 5'-nucleotidase 3